MSDEWMQKGSMLGVVCTGESGPQHFAGAAHGGWRWEDNWVQRQSSSRWGTCPHGRRASKWEYRQTCVGCSPSEWRSVHLAGQPSSARRSGSDCLPIIAVRVSLPVVVLGAYDHSGHGYMKESIQGKVSGKISPLVRRWQWKADPLRPLNSDVRVWNLEQLLLSCGFETSRDLELWPWPCGDWNCSPFGFLLVEARHFFTV